MTSANPNTPSSLVGASVRTRASIASNARRPRMLESLGRSIVQRAVGGIQFGSLRLVDDRHETPIETPGADPAAPAVTIRVLDPGFYSAAAFGGGVGIAEAYMTGAWETDDLPGLIEIITTNIAAKSAIEGAPARLLAPISKAAYWLEKNTRRGSKRNIVAHYDLGNEFFATFLDPTMSYSCAIFENGASTLEAAQREKIDRACRTLDLQRTDHLLEIGSGWGAMAIHAATEYGCRVTTTTISDEQFAMTESRIAEAGLEGRIEVLRRDYRDLEGEYDKLVSIEMIEAVGARNLGTYFDVCSRCLKPDGAALIQAIVIRDQFFKAASRRRDFLKKYIFPGSCLPSVTAMLDAAASRSDLAPSRLEDIGPHYITTLRMWRETFMSRLDEVRAMGFDERFIRMWEYYFAYCEGVFRARHVGDVQLLLTKPRSRLAPAGPRVAGIG